MKFKKGDWVICNGIYHQFFEADEYAPTELYAEDDKYIGNIVACSLWKPQVNEYCWHKERSLVKVSAIIDILGEEAYRIIEASKTFRHSFVSQGTLEEFEPFIGMLPTFIGGN